MNSKEILKFCLEKGMLVDNEVLNLFNDSEDIESIKLIIEKIKSYTKNSVITKNVLSDNKEQVNKFFLDLPKESQKKLERFKIKLGLSIQISKEISTPIIPDQDIINILHHPIVNEKNKSFNSKIDEDVKIISTSHLQSKKLEVGDFVNYFRGRLVKMKEILQERPELNQLISINKISGNRQGISIIGMVADKKITKNKNILLEVEDLTGKIKVIINRNKPEIYEKAEDIALDSVLAFKGSGSREIFFANDLIFPEAMIQERKKSYVEEYVLFIGDMHVGSKLFLEKNFLKFIDYLNGKIPNTPEVEKIKYLFIVGDSVAGVGVYPEQEKELEIKDFEGQFEKLAEILSKIRRDIKIIICPGNHDGIRIMEPQPLPDEKYAWPLYNLKNVILIENPFQVNIGAKKDFSGFNVLVYHGYSYHYYANNIPRLMKEKAVHTPDKLMHYLLKNRHLAPSHSSTLYFPSNDDALMIKDIPDIFVSGHTHKSAVSYYNNILIVCGSSWEAKTPYQEKFGNVQDFCKVPLFNLKTRAIKILDFE